MSAKEIILAYFVVGSWIAHYESMTFPERIVWQALTFAIVCLAALIASLWKKRPDLLEDEGAL